MDDQGIIALNRFFEGIDEMEQMLRVKDDSNPIEQSQMMLLYVVATLAVVFGAFGHKLPRVFLFVHMALIGIALRPYFLVRNAALFSVPSIAIGIALGAIGIRWPKVGVVVLASIAVNRNVYTTYTLPLMARLVVPAITTLIIAKAVAGEKTITMYVLMLSSVQSAVVLSELLPSLLGIETPPTKLLAGVFILLQHFQRVMENQQEKPQEKKE